MRNYRNKMKDVRKMVAGHGANGKYKARARNANKANRRSVHMALSKYNPTPILDLDQYLEEIAPYRMSDMDMDDRDSVECEIIADSCARTASYHSDVDLYDADYARSKSVVEVRRNRQQHMWSARFERWAGWRFNHRAAWQAQLLRQEPLPSHVKSLIGWHGAAKMTQQSIRNIERSIAYYKLTLGEPNSKGFYQVY